MDILKFLTAGSVDDGKSTLIGRLLYDSKSILADQLEAIEKSTKNRAEGEIDLALLTDGLRAEREQGITIDVAYRYFSTDKRKFIVADAPGHIQYTRNMITGASNVSLIIILIDARQGVIEQTKRHSIIASLLKIPRVVVAINKMDLVGYDQHVYEEIVQQYSMLAKALQIQHVQFIPISALKGDNVVHAATTMPWYQGPPLLQHLEEVEIHSEDKHASRFQVQYVIRPQSDELHDYRGYAGRVASGRYKKGDQILVLPQQIASTISKLEVAGAEVDEVFPSQSIVMHLEDDVDISRGDMIVRTATSPKVSNEIQATLCWLDDKPLQTGNKYLLQHNARTVRAIIKQVDLEIDVNSLEKKPISDQIKLNAVVTATIKTASPIAYDPYSEMPENGSAILIDETSNNTVAAVLLN